MPIFFPALEVRRTDKGIFHVLIRFHLHLIRDPAHGNVIVVLLIIVFTPDICPLISPLGNEPVWILT